MKSLNLCGLVAATYTPFHEDGSLNLEVVSPYVERLIEEGVSGLYVCGSTGEGPSLSTSERMSVTEAFIEASADRIPVIVQVGHNSLAESRLLSRHAADSGASAISATCPSYFKIGDVPTLIESMAHIAEAASELPFYYYHIPALTGSAIDMPSFLERAADAVPNLVGLKYTDTKLFEFQACRQLNGEAFDVVWGCDEMLLGALATGARAAIGSTYNLVAPLYRKLTDAMKCGDYAAARDAQFRSVQLVRLMNKHPFHSAMKHVLRLRGIDLGDCRLPQRRMDEKNAHDLLAGLQEIGVFSER